MCFSTTASFASGALLTTIAIASLKKTQNRSQLMLGCIPLLFAIQQFAEGFVWISLSSSGNNSMQVLSTNFFLVFAMVIWPAWVPTAFFLIEKKRVRKLILGAISVMGLVFSIFSSYYLLNYNSLASITPNHIHYSLNVPFGSQAIFGILYLIPTVISHFVSSNIKVNVMGGLIALSYIITRLFFDDEVLSVWCFFSALISIIIYFILIERSFVAQTAPDK